MVSAARAAPRGAAHRNLTTPEPRAVAGGGGGARAPAGDRRRTADGVDRTRAARDRAAAGGTGRTRTATTSSGSSSTRRHRGVGARPGAGGWVVHVVGKGLRPRAAPVPARTGAGGCRTCCSARLARCTRKPTSVVHCSLLRAGPAVDRTPCNGLSPRGLYRRLKRRVRLVATRWRGRSRTRRGARGPRIDPLVAAHVWLGGGGRRRATRRRAREPRPRVFRHDVHLCAPDASRGACGSCAYDGSGRAAARNG